LEEILDIIKALHHRASVLQTELGKIQLAIRAMSGAGPKKIGARKKRTWHHTAATKRKLALAQKRIWDAKRKRN
jgi:hypothetical protein